MRDNPDVTADGRFVVSGERRLAAPAGCDYEPPIELHALTDVPAALAAALAAPIGAPRLRDLAVGAGTVALVVPDTSRLCPTATLLPQLVGELHAAGLGDDDITVVVACGLHRGATADEKAALLGPELRGRFRVVDAQAQSDDIVALDTVDDLAPGGLPIAFDRRVAGAGLVVSLGVVEPHLYAGFSGGAKTVAIGCAGEATIAATHAPAFLDRPGVRVGALDGNPFHDALATIAARTALRFAVNVVLDRGGRVAGLAAGDPAAAQATLVDAHRDAWWRRRAGEYDVVVAGVPAPKHLGLYHASRAATYLALVARPVIADGGLIALCSDLPQGVGDGPGEANFGALLAAARRPADLIARGRHGREPLGPGGQRAYMVARVLERYRLAVVGDGDPELLARLGILHFSSIDEAIAAAAAPRVLVVADAFDTLVERASEPGGGAGNHPREAS